MPYSNPGEREKLSEHWPGERKNTVSRNNRGKSTLAISLLSVIEDRDILMNPYRSEIDT